MRFLADENIPREAVDALRIVGHDIDSIVELHPGYGDVAVATVAVQTGRTLLTFDQDFGELLARCQIELPDGVVLFRIRASGMGDSVSLVVGAITGGGEWVGYLTVVERDRVRKTRL